MNRLPGISLITFIASLFSIVILTSGCDHGLEPGIRGDFGSIKGTILYSGEWPPTDSLVDLRFVAFRTVPQDSSDFANLGNIEFSDKLDFNVDEDHFRIDSVNNGTFPYSVIGQQFSNNVFTDWRPVGLYKENNGVFTVRGDTVDLTIEVNFNDLPPFPPQ